MSESWHKEYVKVTDFISNHPEVKIEPSIVRIGESVRPEFYKLFGAAREAFIKERYHSLVDEAEVLSKHYLQVEEEVIRLLGLECIVPFPRVDNFLRNPMEELIKKLRYPLFDLLKGRMDITGYEQEASSTVTSSFDSLYQQGYEVWMVLSLIKLMGGDKSFRVDTDDFDNDEYFAHGPGGGAVLPKPEEIKQLSFKHNPVVGILAADQIIHSAKLGGYFSFRPHIVEPIGDVESLSVKREWLPLPVDVLKYMDRNTFLVYADKDLEDLSLVADADNICRPDLVIGCFGLRKLYNENSLAKISNEHNAFKPRLGTYIVSRDVVAEKIPEDKQEDIHFLPVGFDQSRLEQIINLFAGKQSNEG